MADAVIIEAGGVANAMIIQRLPAAAVGNPA